MKIGLYSPYVPKHVGGGEKYFFDVAIALRDLGHQVFILLEQGVALDLEQTKPGSAALNYSPTHFREKYEIFLGVSLDGIEFIHSPIGAQGFFLKKLYFTAQFDLIYIITDGSLFFSSAKKNIVHIQIPFTQSKSSAIDRLKLKNWRVKNSNSHFTKNIVEASWRISIPYVHYPMVELPLANFHPLQKEKIILNVGRFFDHLHSKRQDVLVTAFKELCRRQPTLLKGWKLVLVGPAEDAAYARKIAQQTVGLPVEILHEVSRTELLDLYDKATFYWHAAGFEVDEKTHPEKVEHFGISTVEAMNYGCVPLVVGKGGQVEVIGDKLTTLLWQTQGELLNLTTRLINERNEREKFAMQVVLQSKKFNRASFISTLQEMIK